MTPPVARRDARFQQWRALLDNRRKRQQLGLFLVQGVLPISVAAAQDWPLAALLHRPGPLSAWATSLLSGRLAPVAVETAPALLAELAERTDGEAAPEVVAVARMPADDLARLPGSPDLLMIADRPGSPGNLGTLIRTADGLGVSGVIVTGHAADPYDPQAVRASRGSVLAVPVVRVAGPADLQSRLEGMQVVGATEDGSTDLWTVDFARPTAIVVGNEVSGLSRSWADRCSVTARIPMRGSASSLNAAVAGSIALYEVRRQRASRPQ